MKKILILILGIITSAFAYAQSDGFSIYVYAPQQVEKVPEVSIDFLVNSLCSAVTDDGLAAQNDYMTQFLLIPKVNVATKELLTGARQQVVLTVDLHLRIADNISGTVYSSTTINLKGVGTNETKAYNAAFKTLGKNNTKIKEMVAAAKQKIVAYYESQAGNIINRAKLLVGQDKFGEAFYLLSAIPMQCSKYSSAVSTALSLWPKYKDHACAENVAKARAAWTASMDVNGARAAEPYLAAVLPDSKCYGDATQLYNDIKKQMGELWKFQMTAADNEKELDLARIKAMGVIGVAFAKSRQTQVTINKSLF